MVVGPTVGQAVGGMGFKPRTKMRLELMPSKFALGLRHGEDEWYDNRWQVRGEYHSDYVRELTDCKHYRTL